VTAPGGIAILGPAPPDRGGIARETNLLARELSRRGPVSYFTFSRPYPKWLDPRRFAELEHGEPSSAIPALDWLSPRSWPGTADAIAGARPRALVVAWWTAFWGAPVRAVLRRLRRAAPPVRRILLCHNVEDHEATALHRFFSLGAFLAADAYFVHSEAARTSLSRLVPGRPVGICAHPVVEIALPDRREARRRLGIDRPLVLFLGLVRRYKGVDLLLRAAPRIVAETGAQIAIVGESFPDAQEVEKICRDSPVRADILRRDAYVSEAEMSEWLSACDVVVLPYRKIVSSGIAARALAAGRPMAAARVGALEETVAAGVTGELFEPGDADGLARAVATVLSRGASAYASGLQEAARRASWEGYATTLSSFVDSLK
jgi:glycosyltransferase involved in cell wall biosynthesis